MTEIKPSRHEFVLCSVHHESGLEFVAVNYPQRVTIRVRNAMRTSFRLGRTPAPATIRVGFAAAGGPVTFDAGGVRCHGFRVTKWDGAVLELTLDVQELWWFDGEVLTIEISDLSIAADAGAGSIDVVLEGFAPSVDQLQRVALLRLATGGDKTPAAVAARWVRANTVAVGRAPDSAGASLTMQIDPAPAADGGSPSPVYYVALTSGNASGLERLASPARAAEIALTADPAAWRTEKLDVTGMPVWRISPIAGGRGPLDATLAHVVADRPAGSAPVVVYAIGQPGGDGVSVLRARLSASAVSIAGFSVEPAALENITVPTQVLLSWATVNASAVTLSGVGVVAATQEQLPVWVEQTTTFVLTAFDSALDQIVSRAKTVTVEPDLVTRLVPAGTIMLWHGATTDVPTDWALCDGTNGTPDLRDRFVMGAGGSAKPRQSGDADTHTHPIAQLSKTFQTSTDPGHTHAMPSAWYARNLSSGSHTGIDTRYDFPASTQTGGQHHHTVEVTFPAFTSGPNNQGVRPAWYALCYIMKVAAQ